MTSPQRTRLHNLAREIGVDVPSHLTRTEADDLIGDLEAMAERG